MRPIIAITSTGKHEAYLESRYYQSYYASPSPYVDAVRKAGGVPIILPPIHPDEAQDILQTVNAIIIAGGADVSPEFYGGNSEHPHLTKLDKERDASEIAIVQQMIEMGDKPLFCVCRGMQVLNVALGGTMYEHIPDILDDDMHRKDSFWTLHEVEVDSHSRLAQIMQSDTVKTYSGHHQAVKTLGEGLSVVAKAADGITEALTYENHPWVLGVQWHPEKSAAEDMSQQRLFDAVVEAAKERMKF
jgi:putative glutamine amidotransferase